MSKGFAIHAQVKERRAEIERRLASWRQDPRGTGATVIRLSRCISYGRRHPRLADYIEDVEGAEILSIGYGLELIKDLGDADRVRASTRCAALSARTPSATRAWRRNPTSTSARRIPTGLSFADVSVVHNGQLTNY